MHTRSHNLRTRRGVTLIELLIVLTIMLMVTAAAIPMVVPATQNRQMRETARLVSSYFSGARSRAIETGRPVGVAVERFNGGPFALNLSYVEVPTPYSGDSATSRAIVKSGEITSDAGSFPVTDAGWQNLLRYGDLVRFDFKGPLYMISSVNSIMLNSQTASDVKTGQVLTAPSAMNHWFLLRVNPQNPNQLMTGVFPDTFATAPGVSFQVFRQPVRSSAAPLQLPEGVVIDLTSSGWGLNNVFNENFAPASMPYDPRVTINPTVIFEPNGSVSQVILDRSGLRRIAQPIYFLLGRRELMYDITQDGTSKSFANRNLSEPPPMSAASTVMPGATGFWIAIGPQTGLVTSSEIAPSNQDYTQPTMPGPPTPLQTALKNAVQQSRAIAKQAQTGGGP